MEISTGNSESQSQHTRSSYRLKHLLEMGIQDEQDMVDGVEYGGSYQGQECLADVNGHYSFQVCGAFINELGECLKILRIQEFFDLFLHRLEFFL